MPIKEEKDAAASGSDSSVSDHKDEKPTASSAKGKDKDEDEQSPKRKRKGPVSEINEDLLEDDEKVKLEQRRAYNRACAAKARKRSKDLIATLQEQVESLTRDKAQLERTNDVMRAQLDLLEQQNRSIMQQQHRGIPMQHMQQPQMMQHPQHQMAGMMQANQGQPIYITSSGQHAYAPAQPGHYIEVQQPQQPGAPVGMPSGAMTQVHGRPGGYPTVGLGNRIVQQQQGQPTNGSQQQAPQSSSPGGSTSAPAPGGSMDSNPKYFLS